MWLYRTIPFVYWNDAQKCEKLEYIKIDMLELVSTCGCWVLTQEKLSTGLYAFLTLLRNLQRVKEETRGLGFEQRKLPRIERKSEIFVRTQTLQPDSINIISQWEKTTEQLRNSNIAKNSLLVTHTRYQD